MSSHSEKSLGLEARILRRDFMNGMVIGSGSMLMGAAAASAKEFTGVGDYRGANGNPPDLMQAARDSRWRL